MDLHYLDLYWVLHKKGAKYWPGCIGLSQVWVKSFGGGGNEPKIGGSKPWLNRAAWNRQGFGAPISNTRLTVVALLSRPSYLQSPPTNGRTDGRTQGRTCPPTRRKRAFDRRWKGVWRRRQNTGKKERVCDRRRHRRRRTSFCGDQRKVRASVRVCFVPGSSRAFVVVVRFAAFVCAVVLLFSPPSSIL